jgi:hypothetical protein
MMPCSHSITAGLILSSDLSTASRVWRPLAWGGNGLFRYIQLKATTQHTTAWQALLIPVIFDNFFRKSVKHD